MVSRDGALVLQLDRPELGQLRLPPRRRLLVVLVSIPIGLVATVSIAVPVPVPVPVPVRRLPAPPSIARRRRRRSVPVLPRPGRVALGRRRRHTLVVHDGRGGAVVGAAHDDARGLVRLGRAVLVRVLVEHRRVARRRGGAAGGPDCGVAEGWWTAPGRHALCALTS